MLTHTPANHKAITITVPHWGIGAQITAIASWMQQPDTITATFKTSYLFEIPPIPPETTPICTNRNHWLPINIHMDPDKLAIIRKHAQPLLTTKLKPPHIPPKTLGIHYRGTDKHGELSRPYEIGPTYEPTPIKKIMQQAYELKQEKNLTHILLCTDDENIHIPPECIHFPNHLRNQLGHFETYDALSYHRIAPEQQARHTIEALTELLALAQCEHLLIGRSCFSEAALILGNSTYTYYH